MLFFRLLPRYDDAPTTPVVAKPVIKSWDELRKEAKAEAKKKYAKRLGIETEAKAPKAEETPEVKKEATAPVAEETPVVKEPPKAEEPKIDVEAVAKKAADEAATRVASETKDAFQKEVEKILDKDKDIQEKQKEADELIAAWDKEGRLPKDYPELISETMRIAEAKFDQKQRALETKAKEDKSTETPTAPVAPVTPPAEGDEAKKLEAFQKEISADLEDIYEAKFLPKPSDVNEINNPTTTDPAAKETQKLFEFGVKLNVARKEKGLPAITSLSKIYFLHYKPMVDSEGKKSDQPPGADAPVSPSGTQSNTETNKPQPFYQKGEDGHYYPKSWAQIKYEQVRARLGSK